MPTSQQTYNSLWESSWGDIQYYGPVHRHTRSDLVRTIAQLEVGSVIDIGCGSGENLAALASAGNYSLTGTDLSDEALTIAKRQLPAGRFLQLDIEHEALQERFDLVMSSQVIEHIVDDLAALKNMASMSNRYVLVATMQGAMRRSELKIGHVRNYSQVELARKLEIAGLEVIRLWGWGFPFYSPLIRTLTEFLPGQGPPLGKMGPLSRLAAALLYQTYKLNWPGKGDVLTALARKAAL